jgi:carbamoyl-phosphate synthase small subunit
MPNDKTAILALENGEFFYGTSIGVKGITTGEVVFNTSQTGYQEILTDPSYAGQMILFTNPHVGNAGVNDEDMESGKIWASGLIVREMSPIPSNWRSKKSLNEFLIENKVVGISGIDTRKLTRMLSNRGALKGCIISQDPNIQQALALAKNSSSIIGLDLSQGVGTQNPYRYSRKKNPENFSVVVYDFGVKLSILKALELYGCDVTVIPAKTPAREVLNMNPKGIVLSNGPGDPRAAQYAIDTVKELLKVPIPLLGICFGFQLLALAAGAKIHKMKFGHHGANHPLFDIKNQKVLISSQNHGFALDSNSLPNTLMLTHYSLFDGSAQGLELTNHPSIGFQGHPEAAPGPLDMHPLFIQYMNLVSGKKALCAL